MCDPLTIASLAIGAAGTAANYIGKNKAEKEQKQEVGRWQNYQRRARMMEEERQAKMRNVGEKEVSKLADTLGGENQAAVQGAEATRLEGELSEGTAPTAVADEAILSGQQAGGQVFQSDMARALSDATASAQQRIGALAELSSYGGSEGGLQTVMPIALSQAGNKINQQNNYRAGSMAAFGLKTQVPPKQIEYSNPLADIAQSFLGAGMAGAGKAVGTAFGAGMPLSSVFANAFNPRAFTFPPAPAAPFTSGGLY